jgi:hypothetical protein
MKDIFYKEFRKYHMNILLKDFSAKVGREDIFKPTVGNESLQETSNDNGVMCRPVNFPISENLTVKSMMFPHPNIHKYMSSDGKTHNQFDHILVDG